MGKLVVGDVVGRQRLQLIDRGHELALLKDFKAADCEWLGRSQILFDVFVVLRILGFQSNCFRRYKCLALFFLLF